MDAMDPAIITLRFEQVGTQDFSETYFTSQPPTNKRHSRIARIYINFQQQFQIVV
jgi:NADH:ubiquinone oxidoreductase subunit